MAIGRISGLLLQDNLERQAGGVTKNLAIDTDLTYFDVYNRRLGINTTSPQYSLDVLGNVQLGNLVIYNNTIISTTGQIDLGTVANVKISGGSPSQFITTDGSGNLSFTTVSTGSISNGTSNVSVSSSGTVYITLTPKIINTTYEEYKKQK